MARLKKWDQKVLDLGNGVCWLSTASWFGFITFKTEIRILNAWGRKRNLSWLGRLDVGGFY